MFFIRERNWDVQISRAIGDFILFDDIDCGLIVCIYQGWLLEEIVNGATCEKVLKGGDFLNSRVDRF